MILRAACTHATPVALLPGTRLGPYDIVGPLGAGGMGEGYRARDAELKRGIALKILSAAVVTDTDRLDPQLARCS